MTVRIAVLNTTRRSFPDSARVLAPRAQRLGPIDSFESVDSRLVASSQSAVSAAPSSSSGGGFFSRLFKRLKTVAGGLVSQVGTWFKSKVGGWIAEATDFVNGFLTKAATWVSAFLDALKLKLGT